MKDNLFNKFARFGVLHREELKNNLGDLQPLVKQGMVQKVYKRGRVFYEMTPEALPLLEWQRHVLEAQARMQAAVHPQSAFYRALLTDLRFLDEKHPAANAFLFLGNWDLARPAAKAQLELSKLRYYQDRGLA